MSNEELTAVLEQARRASKPELHEIVAGLVARIVIDRERRKNAAHEVVRHARPFLSSHYQQSMRGSTHFNDQRNLEIALAIYDRENL